jgi:hypothetical protein
VAWVLDDGTAVYEADRFTLGPLDELEAFEFHARVSAAAQCGVIARTLADAERNPDPWCGPDPTLDRDWVDPRARTVARVGAERREHAVRAAVWEIAVRLRISESMVRVRAFTAETLRRK